MFRVFNWQLNREMDYPFQAVRPNRQFAAVFNINRCIGCQTCTMACKSTWTFNKGQELMWWNNVETKPYGSYPHHWDGKILSTLGPQDWKGETYTGKTIFESASETDVALGYLPEDKEWRYPNIYEDTPPPWTQGASLPVHATFFFYLQRICNHCTYPACLVSCPREAIYKRREDGIVLIDQERCRGYQECVQACPYKKSMFNLETRGPEKCIGCYPKIEQGLQTQCTTVCIGRLRLTNFLSTPDKADPRKPADFLVHVKKIALPLYPQLGLEPNVYYIPPVHVPTDYLVQMFGPGVPEAIETYMNAKDDPELLGLLMLFGATERIISTFDVADGVARGYDEERREIVAVPLREPTFVRPFEFATELKGEPVA